jgi:hypothetical protein
VAGPSRKVSSGIAVVSFSVREFDASLAMRATKAAARAVLLD